MFYVGLVLMFVGIVLFLASYNAGIVILIFGAICTYFGYYELKSINSHKESQKQFESFKNKTDAVKEEFFQMHTFARFKFDKMLELAKVQSNIYMMEIEYNDLYNLIREMRFAQRFVDSNRYSSTEKLSNHYWRLILEFKKDGNQYTIPSRSFTDLYSNMFENIDLSELLK